MSGAASHTKPRRLSKGGLIDRSKPLSFTFDGEHYQGYAGDTLASALLSNGVKLVGRSFKYHRPRGILTAGSEEPNALVELRSGARREPNTRATMIELFDGLYAQSQNRWPSLKFDIGAVNSLLSPFFAAGFYYKTFMWPASFWEKVYEPAIRQAAGLGRASMEADPDVYEKLYAFCDVLVIGGGAAGLAAALSAGRSGARAILCDEDHVLGGRLNGDNREIGGESGSAWAHHASLSLDALPNVRVLRRTTVFGVYDSGTYGAVERVSDHLPVPAPHQPRQRLWKIVAKRAVLATGAIERPIVFGGNDRPCVMMASAVRSYLNRFAVAAGHRAAIFTGCDDAWRTAFDLVGSGIPVEAIIDMRSDVDSRLIEKAGRLGIPVFAGARVVKTRGRQGLKAISVRSADGQTRDLAVDLLAMSGGWNPNLALTTHLGGRPSWSDALAAFVPNVTPPGMTVAGAAQGSFALADAVREGDAAGTAAAEAAGFATQNHPLPQADDEAIGSKPFWYVADSRSKAFVDFQHDVTSDDIALAAREGFQSVELLKRYTTLGMATDQGKTSNVNGHALMAQLTGRQMSQVGTTVFRPPYTPVAIGALAGHHRGSEFKPTRLTAGHGWAEERGATFVEAGQWLRAQWFAQPGETHWLTTVSREVREVRSRVGVCDVSTLGKIDVQGNDAAAFLDRVYVNMFSTLPIGKVRYGLMLREDGVVMDDGTAARFATDHYVVSTTTANAAKVMQHLEHARQILWPELDVQLVSVTEQWSQYSIAGPYSRRLLAQLLGDAAEISDAAFPYLGCIEFRWRNVPARLFRVSFSGELAYELAVPAQFGDATIRTIMEVGSELGVVPYGTEALGVMRIEKGHVAGNELNGTTTATDLGLGRMMSRKKDFIGRMLAMRPGLAARGRPALIGVKPVAKTARLHAGAHFLGLGAKPNMTNDEGYVTSVAYSPMLEHWIGLGLIQNGLARIGEIVRAYDPVRNRDTEVEIVSPIFFDPEGTRLHG
ncbi:heterotetrameric sarcosine oxidase alpha subunit [Bradyrhizobium sp. USDA 4524]|uniref:sarcosine oxidase subunit alpha family protein n=1 Tax=unclassified Bradyrhizobium TaxID=2631580 RepID=UPI0020A13A6D|nr:MULTISPECIES: sarcosine oxidase subunit alpha family protein [unclassified Bradyrhizobium]MCP1845668.1 sarcosine oxidase subunit alpha [Bradyrhizobium sp. USDA 4538]MCP1907008.1 sarcosine oxidase subunit alpha [Bradyrhizobium sp. USDA 4537]MCP1985484.1 sarcosine oxidase subunit alpha [Bradyrhizobium sp. USDA 4539]